MSEDELLKGYGTNLGAAPVLAEPSLMGSNADSKASGEVRESNIRPYRNSKEPDSRGGAQKLLSPTPLLSSGSGNAAGSSAKSVRIPEKAPVRRVVPSSRASCNDVYSQDFVSLLDPYFGNWSVEERRSFPCWSGSF